ncbi:MAG: thiamine pyrophosphate-dependent dehydrogenase E1 component subunit alpha [Planctomycetota bacterium]
MVKISDKTKVKILRTMYLIREFEIASREVFKTHQAKGEFLGALHNCDGQEAIAAAMGAILRTDDYVFTTFRGHGHYLAKGADPRKMMAELLGRKAGYSKGRGGSMHMFDPSIGLMGGNGVVGGGMTLAAGAALTAQYKGTDQICVCFFGDGAAAVGAFHESLNLAGLWKLPVVYICENNLWAATTHISFGCPIENISDRAAAYGLPGKNIDGNDVYTVYEGLSQAVKRARKGDGPTLIECKTYRHYPHCMVIPEHRPKDEKQAWLDKDPIPRFEKVLQDEKVFGKDEQTKLRKNVQQLLAEAIEFAQNSPLPEAESLYEYVWA